MDFQFNPAQLSRCQRNSLMDVLGVIQSENVNELVVTPVEFPSLLKVKLDDDIEMMLGWNTEKQSYSGLTTPERLEQDIKDLAQETAQPEPDPIPESQKDTVDLPEPDPKPKPEPKPELVTFGYLDMSGKFTPAEPEPTSEPTPESELDLSPVFVRADALARAFVKLSMPLNIEQRVELWGKFCIVLAEELWK